MALVEWADTPMGENEKSPAAPGLTTRSAITPGSVIRPGLVCARSTAWSGWTC